MGDEDQPRSPMTAKSAITDEQVALQLQQFLDDWNYRFMSCSSLGKAWNRSQVIGAVLDVLILNGCELTPSERHTFPKMEEYKMIDELVDRMSEQLRASFETFSSQMQAVMKMITRVRTSIDKPTGEDPMEEVFEEIDSTKVGQQIMQMAVVVASKEVAKIQRCQNTWIETTEKRVARLQNSNELAEHAQQQLLAVEAQLEQLNGDKKAQSKQMLVNMADGSDKALTNTVFSAWMGLMLKMRSEHAVRKKFTDHIENLENQLYAYKERQLSGVRNHFIRQANENKGGLLGTIWQVWAKEVVDRKRDGDTASELKKLEAIIAQSKGESAAKAKQALTKMCGNRDSALVGMVFQAFLQFHADYAKDKEFEDQVKKSEKALKDHMQASKDKSKSILNRVNAGSDSGLLSLCITGWIKIYEEDKQHRKLEEAMGGADGKFKSLQSRQLQNVHGVQGRVNEQMKMNLLVKVFYWWQIESKCNAIERHYAQKLDGKRRQLAGVQTLFKSFSQQLEAGLTIDGDSSGRGSTQKSRQRSLARGNPDSVSLPDINARPAVA